LVEGLLSEGVEVWAGSRDAERVKQTGLAVRPAELDLGDPDAVDRFLANPPWEKKPVLLINNAGYGQFGELCSVSAMDLERQVTAMLTSAMKLCRLFLSTSGDSAPAPAVVNVSSLAVEFPLPYLHGYNAVKAGLSGFSRSLEIEFPGGENRPFVLDLRPGDFRTGFNEAVLDSGKENHLSAVWAALDHHLQNGSDPSSLWPVVRKALLNERSKTVRAGTLFQARVAPLLGRMFPESWVAHFQKRYYGIRATDGDKV